MFESSIGTDVQTISAWMGNLWFAVVAVLGERSHLSDSNEMARRRKTQTQVGQGRIATGSFRLHPAIPSRRHPPLLKGERIPRAAGIVAVADVKVMHELDSILFTSSLP